MIAPEINFSHSLVGFIEKLGYTNIYIGESETRIDKKERNARIWLEDNYYY